MKNIKSSIVIGVVLFGAAATGCSKAADTAAVTTTTVKGATTTAAGGDKATTTKAGDSSTTKASGSGSVATLSLETCASIALENLDLATGAAPKRAAAKTKMVAEGKPPADVEAAMQVMADVGLMGGDPKAGKASDVIKEWMDKACPTP